MKVEVSVDIAFPRERVFRAYRDELPRLVGGLENVKEIIVTSRVEDAGVVKLASLWRANADVPSMAKRFVPEWIEWDDFADWNESNFTATYRTQSRLYPPSLDSRGGISFHEIASGTRMDVRGELNFDASKVPGVPRFLVSTANPLIERFLVGQITPNFLGIAKSLEQHLRA